MVEREKKKKKEAEHKTNEWGIEVVGGGDKDNEKSGPGKVEVGEEDLDDLMA